MPSVLIEVRKEYTPEQEVALIEAVSAAFTEVWKIPAAEKNIRLVVHPPHRFAVSPELEQPEMFTQISIDVRVGRSLDAKGSLYRALEGSLAFFGIRGDHLRILLREISKENSGIRGPRDLC